MTIIALLLLSALIALYKLYSFEVSANALIFYDMQIQDTKISFAVSQTDSGYYLKNYKYSIKGTTLEIRFYGTLFNIFAMRTSTITIENLPEIKRIDCQTTKGNTKTIWEST